MKGFGTYISKHLLRFGVVLLLLLLLNAIAFALTFYSGIQRYYGAYSPTRMLETLAENVSQDGFAASAVQTLQSQNLWAMYLDGTGDCCWSISRPREVPKHYSLQDVAVFSKGYLADYPVFLHNIEDGLLVLGYPKDSYMKFNSNYLPISLVEMLPVFAFGLLVTDCLLLFLAYVLSRRSILKNAEPILSAVETLGEGRPAKLSIHGELSPIAESINKVSQRLQAQNTARANWISGVSHDIRTPLSMLLGYAQRIAQNDALGEDVRKQAEIMQFQSIQIKELVQDLNLVSQLEYEMQPLRREPVHLARLLRRCAADRLNAGLPEEYTLSVEITPEAEAVVLEGDARLLSRAVGNLLQNSLKHNPQGCVVKLGLDCTEHTVSLTVSDNGVGLSEETLRNLKETPHYMESTDESLTLRHGLGLLLVRQIVQAQNGQLSIENGPEGGCKTTLSFPIRT